MIDHSKIGINKLIKIAIECSPPEFAVGYINLAGARMITNAIKEQTKAIDRNTEAIKKNTKILNHNLAHGTYTIHTN